MSVRTRSLTALTGVVLRDETPEAVAALADEAARLFVQTAQYIERLALRAAEESARAAEEARKAAAGQAFTLNMLGDHQSIGLRLDQETAVLAAHREALTLAVNVARSGGFVEETVEVTN